MKVHNCCWLTVWLAAASTPTIAEPPLIVVENAGGASAKPYYQALQLPGNPPALTTPAPTASALAQANAPPPARRLSEADLLPVRSTLLSPGDAARRALEAPGLRPLFLIGDDPRSRNWLRQRLPALRALGAAGLVVNVESEAALQSLRALAGGTPLSPAPGDDLAQRLGIRHYPVIITATSIEP